MLRPVPIQHYLSVMKARGHCEDKLLEGTHIDLHSLHDPSYLIDHSDLDRLLTNMLALEGDNGLGLDIGLNNDIAHYGILAYSGLSCPTIRQGIHEIWSKYGQAFGIMSRLELLSREGSLATIEITVPCSEEPKYRFIVEEAFCLLFNIGGSLTGVTPPFKKLQLAYTRPRYHDRYKVLFGCPVEFSAARTCVTIKRDWLDIPLKTSDAELNRICREHLAHVLKLSEANTSMTLKLRHFLMGTQGKMPSLDEAAREFRISSRTLARRLNDEGHSFRQITEEVRKELAEKWLNSTRMTTKEISFSLGFRDVGAFRRAFKCWTGQTVSEYCQVSRIECH